jgi:NTE family protein
VAQFGGAAGRRADPGPRHAGPTLTRRSRSEFLVRRLKGMVDEARSEAVAALPGESLEQLVEPALAPRGTAPHRPRIGLVLGSGSARGWAHIGVIRALERVGIRPDIVCGTSVGALVGAAFAAGNLDEFEDWVRHMKRRDVISFMDVGLSGGLLKGVRVLSRIRAIFEDRPIEELDLPFGAVATALRTGAEVWLREGSTLDAVRASIAMPGLFAPALRDGVVLVDGGLVNPVPVSLGRAMGADVVIAVDLGSDLLSPHVVSAPAERTPHHVGDWLRKLHALWPASVVPRSPSLTNVVAASLNIMQVRITRSRMAGEPPEIAVAPRLAHLGLLDFHRAEEAIAEGERAMGRAIEDLKLLGLEHV